MITPKVHLKDLSPSNSQEGRKQKGRRKESSAISHLSSFKTPEEVLSASGDLLLWYMNLPDLLHSEHQCKELI